MRALLERLLARESYACATAGSAAEARERLSEHAFELILCDVQMPGESGIDLLGDVLANTPDTAAIMVTGLDDAALARRALEMGAYGYVIKPFRSNELLIAVMNALRRRQLEIASREQRQGLEGTVEARTRALEDAIVQLRRSSEELHHSRAETIRRLSWAVEYRDPETGGHIERMSRYCALLADRLGLDATGMRMASPLHDVGKIAVPDSILLKPGALTAEERVSMERHAAVGHRVLAGSSSELLELAATIAWSHHEKWDGSGYPRALAGSQIPLEGRVAAVADVFDALSSDRAYRPAMPLEDALGIMRAGRAAHFDPQVLDIFLASLDEVLEIRAHVVEEPVVGPEVGGA